MSDPLAIIDDVVAGRWIAPETGGPLRSSIERVEIRPSLAGLEHELVASLRLGSRLAVVADERSVEAMGHRVAAALPDAELVVLNHPKPDEATADALQERLRHVDGLVAVGSGSINDLCKYIGHRTGRGCAVFATALSMDGYVTSTVSITRGGFKLSLPAQAPKGVFFDLHVLADAPPHMTLAGFGDTICRTTAQVDWLLSHLLLDTFYAQTPYDLMAEDEPKLFAVADRLVPGDQDAILILTRMLALSGLGVLVTGTSHCGSMTEHAISHYIDMLAAPHPRTLHGQQVGIATWTMARAQAALLERPSAPVLQPLDVGRLDFEGMLGKLAPACRTAIATKPWDGAATERLNRRLGDNWASIRERLKSVMLPLATLDDVIRRAGMPRTAAELGIDPALYQDAVGRAHLTRDRYGALDVMAQEGTLAAFARAET